jgi:DNA-binding transcriptional MerR regulator
MPEMLTIGKAARESGLTPDTVRYYERLRLIERPRRSNGGYRLYNERALERLRFIRHARSLGFSLDEVGALFVQHSSGAKCVKVRELLESKIVEIDRRVVALTQFRTSLVEYRSRCDRAIARSPVRRAAAHC